MQARPPQDAPTLTQWRMVSILCLVNAIAFIDRTALPLLVQPIKRDLGISDTLMSFLIGAAFITTYAFGGSLIGVLVDRYPRRQLFVCMLASLTIVTIALPALPPRGTALPYVAYLIVQLVEHLSFGVYFILVGDYFSALSSKRMASSTSTWSSQTRIRNAARCQHSVA